MYNRLWCFLIVGIVNESEYGVVSWGTRRSVLEGPSLILAAERTHRKDPFDNFKYYTGGWNISDHHYFYVSLFKPLFHFNIMVSFLFFSFLVSDIVMVNVKF
ncbi:hypothetical protein CsSME_00007402 [Camellia sinensis var. sinensis]